MDIGAITQIDKHVDSQDFIGHEDLKSLLVDMLNFCEEKKYSISAIFVDGQAFWNMFIWPDGFRPHITTSDRMGYFVHNNVGYELWVRLLNDDKDISIRAYSLNDDPTAENMTFKHWLNGTLAVNPESQTS